MIEIWYNFRNHDEEYENILNSLWLVAITFWCIGYGDIVPNTYCGRGICLICGTMVRMNFFGGGLKKEIESDLNNKVEQQSSFVLDF